MKTQILVAVMLVGMLSTFASFARMDEVPSLSASVREPLDQNVKDFELAYESLIDGIAKLSQLPIELHFGVEEILGNTFTDRVAREQILLGVRCPLVPIDARCGDVPACESSSRILELRS
jgi:hypothetical protein